MTDQTKVLSLVVKGDRHVAARAAADRGIPFAFQTELDRETVGLAPIAFRHDARAWFSECTTVPPFPAGTLLLISEIDRP